MVKLADSDIEYFSEGKGEAPVLLPGGNLTVGYMDGLSHALAIAGYRAVRINFEAPERVLARDKTSRFTLWPLMSQA